MHLFRVLVILSMLFVCPSDLLAKMYKWVDGQGQIHWSDTPPIPEENAKGVEEHETVEDKQKEKNLHKNQQERPVSKERRYGRKNELFP